MRHYRIHWDYVTINGIRIHGSMDGGIYPYSLEHVTELVTDLNEQFGDGSHWYEEVVDTPSESV